LFGIAGRAQKGFIPDTPGAGGPEGGCGGLGECERPWPELITRLDCHPWEWTNELHELTEGKSQTAVAQKRKTGGIPAVGGAIGSSVEVSLKPSRMQHSGTHIGQRSASGGERERSCDCGRWGDDTPQDRKS